MGVIGGEVGYQILRRLKRSSSAQCDGSAFANHSKLEVLLGKDIWQYLQDKVVLDFGCDEGDDAVAAAKSDWP